MPVPDETTWKLAHSALFSPARGSQRPQVDRCHFHTAVLVVVPLGWYFMFPVIFEGKGAGPGQLRRGVRKPELVLIFTV